MQRLAPSLGAALLLGAAALQAGCGNGASSLTTSALPGDAPPITNEDPMARPAAVAWTSARAKRCGFYFDPAKLRASYLTYESRQGAAGEQLAKIEKSYDTTFKVISDRVSSEADYCTEKKGAEIKAHLERHLAGDYAANFPKPKVAESCGFFGCGGDTSTSDDPFSAKDFWKKQDSDPRSKR